MRIVGSLFVCLQHRPIALTARGLFEQGVQSLLQPGYGNHLQPRR